MPAMNLSADRILDWQLVETYHVLSPKYSLLNANASIRTICNTADGIESILLSKVENPILLSVKDK